MRQRIDDLVTWYLSRYRPESSAPRWDLWEEDQIGRLNRQEPQRYLEVLSKNELLIILRSLCEPAYQEISTASFLSDYLLSRGCYLSKVSGYQPNKTHLIFGKRKDVRVVLRCDLDAVSIGGGQYQHWCGHDLNMTALISVWCSVVERYGADVAHRIGLVFQPAEEGPGHLEDGFVHPDDIAGGLYLRLMGIYRKEWTLVSCHVDTGLLPGQVRCTSGIATCSAYKFESRFLGKPGHAAMRDQGINPLVSAQHFLRDVDMLNIRFKLGSVEDTYCWIAATQLNTENCEVHNLSPSCSLRGIARVRGLGATTALQRLFQGSSRDRNHKLRLETPSVLNDQAHARLFAKIAKHEGYSVLTQPIGFRDESGWACDGNSLSPDGHRLPKGCGKVLHFFVSAGGSAGNLHSTTFDPDVTEVLRSETLLLESFAMHILPNCSKRSIESE